MSQCQHISCHYGGILIIYFNYIIILLVKYNIINVNLGCLWSVKMIVYKPPSNATLTS